MPRGSFTPEARAKYPGINALCSRSLDVLEMAGVKVPEAVPRFIETGQSAGRGGMDKSSKMFCLTAKSRPYITSRCRVMHGKEYFRMQGIFYPPTADGTGGDDALDGVSHADLIDLAGNAFHSGCCAAALLALLVAMARAYALHRKKIVCAAVEKAVSHPMDDSAPSEPHGSPDRRARAIASPSAPKRHKTVQEVRAYLDEIMR